MVGVLIQVDALLRLTHFHSVYTTQNFDILGAFSALFARFCCARIAVVHIMQ